MELSDVGSERAVLAGIYQYGNDALIDVSDIITYKTFTDESNRILYSCLIKVLENHTNIDLTSVLITAEHMGLKNHIIKAKQDIEFLRSLFTFPIILENVRSYAQRIAKLEIVRQIRTKYKEIYDELGKIKGYETIDEILAIAEKGIFDLIQELYQGKESQPQKIGENSDQILEQLMNNPSEMVGLPTPWPCYNTLIGGGLRRGGVTLWCARPKRGKTTCAKEIALHLSIYLNIPVLYLETEMNFEDQLFRSLSSLSSVDITEIETGKFGQQLEVKERVLEANRKLKGIPFFHKVIASKPFDEVLSIIRRWIIKEVGYDENGRTKDCLVIYDYFKLMSPEILEDMQEYQAIGFQISKLSDFCKIYDFPCFATVQTNRDAIKKDTSDVLAQSDRLLWLCHSASIFKERESEERMDSCSEANCKLIIIDTRYGPGMSDPANYINFKFDKNISKVTELGLQQTLQQSEIISKQGFEEITNVQFGNDFTEID